MYQSLYHQCAVPGQLTVHAQRQSSLHQPTQSGSAGKPNRDHVEKWRMALRGCGWITMVMNFVSSWRFIFPF